MQDVNEFLLHETSEISDVALQRISNIVVRYLNNSSSVGVVGVGNGMKPLQKAQNSLHQLVTHDEILGYLYNCDRRSHDNFLDKLENYVSSLFVSASAQTTQNNSIDHDEPQLTHQSQLPYDRRTDSNYLDLAPKQIVAPFVSTPKSNEVLSALRKDETAFQHGHSPVIPPALADIVAVIVPQQHVQPQPEPQLLPNPIHILPMNNNQDLAEADQVCSNEEANALANAENQLYLMEEDFINNPIGSNAADSIGAVGGIATSQLPDLANVTQAPSRIISFEEESVSLANAEVERITSQSFDIMAVVPPNNSSNDAKPKNQ